ncbi:unnamed protein product [Medioppia subpectinata]|uniref:ABC transporter domain-containing protein n=1 Tax=Medioppia subpectinata TaxID=1979941 RepID=A0A7R9L1W4_9ACAR|nr:unnamed protein product [Medioppia subpectinata]CAG2112774.1 unnamed protein product [Medioppia subpectinata]
MDTSRKMILDQINGHMYMSSLNALMGPSGAGKTTLLKCLNGQNNRGLSDRTKIYLTKYRQIRSCFIKSDFREHLLSELVISDTADNRVESCSGGEQKRIIIACEMTAHIKPNMLCIDEPTSGLDSNAADVVSNKLFKMSNMRPVFGSLNISKRFSFIDIYYLLCRSLTHTFRCQWVSVLLQFISIQMLAIVLKYGFSADIILPDGCVELEIGGECYQTEAELRDERLIKNNIKYNLCLLLSLAFVVLIVMSVTFGADFRIFRSQQQNGWYSTGSYLWCRTIVDLLPVLMALPLFCWIANLYNTITFYVFTFALNLLVIMCTQSVSQLSAILFANEPKMALMFAIMSQTIMLILGNSLIPVKELHYTMQVFSQFSYIRLSFECMVIMIYGFDRCQGNQVSTVLYGLEIDDDQFWTNIVQLI